MSIIPSESKVNEGIKVKERYVLPVFFSHIV